MEEEENKPGSPPRTWGELLPSAASSIASSWRRKSKSEPEGGKQEEAQSTFLAAKPSDNEASSSSSKSWGDMLPSLSFRPGKSEQEQEAAVVEEVQPNPENVAENVISEEKESEAKTETTEKKDTHKTAKTWGEMIHPALKPSHWRKKSRDEGEPSESDGGKSKEELVDEALKETSDDVPSAAEGTLSAVAASLRRSIEGMSRWSVADLTLGLYKLSGRHTLEGAADTIDGSPVSSLDELKELLHWFHWAFAAYKKDKQKLVKELEIEESQIIKHVFTSAILKPAYFIAVDHARRCVVMSIRGTLAATDVLTDLNPHSEEFEGGSGHSGMLAAARWLMENETKTLQEVLAANPGYRFVLVGHSLGAGTAVLLCMLLREYDSKGAGPLSRLGIPPSWITCWGYGCPPCVDKRLAEDAAFIHNVVLQDDVVARVTPAALEDLRTEILDTDWSQAFQDGSKGKKMVELVQSTYAALPGSEIAKKYGNAALAVAKSGALAGTRIHKAANWFAVGIAAAQLLQAASSHAKSAYGNVPNSEEGADVTAASVAVTAAEAGMSTKEALEAQRLYVPGVLYHILRKPLSPSAIQLALEFPEDKRADKKEKGTEKPKEEEHKETKKSREQEEKAGQKEEEGSEKPEENQEKGTKKSKEKENKRAQFEHIVVRGDDPSSRFKRIVLSGTLLSDHGCLQYQEALIDAIRWAASRSSKE